MGALLKDLTGATEALEGRDRILDLATRAMAAACPRGISMAAVYAVKTWLQRLYKRAGVRNRGELAALARGAPAVVDCP